MSQTYFIAGDWGTSNLRVYLFEFSEKTAKLVATKQGPGIKEARDHFEATLFELVSGWLEQHGQIPIILSGMIGSNIGWKEADYLPCPATPSDIAGGRLTLPSRGLEISILPGLRTINPLGHPDVMRGEELQILGWLQQQAPEVGERNLLVLPGTHNKWAVLDGNRVTSFLTAFTGELFDLLKRHSVLIGKTELDDFCEAAFVDGVRTVEQSRGASLIHTLFAVRSNQLLANKSVEHSLSFLSGQIIATDIRGALEVFEGINNITIIGDTKLADRYQLVLEHWGHRVERCHPEEIAARGYESVYCTLFT